MDIRMVFARLKHAKALALKRDLFDVPGSSEKIANVKSGTLYLIIPYSFCAGTKGPYPFE